MVSRWNKAGPLLHANLNTVVQGTLEKRENKKLVTVDIFTNGKSVRLALLVFQASNSERKKKKHAWGRDDVRVVYFRGANKE